MQTAISTSHLKKYTQDFPYHLRKECYLHYCISRLELKEGYILSLSFQRIDRRRMCNIACDQVGIFTGFTSRRSTLDNRVLECVAMYHILSVFMSFQHHQNVCLL